MEKCPHCGKELCLPPRAYINADIYSKSNVVATDCCGKGVHLIPKRSYRIEAYNGSRTEDDWGVEFSV